MSIQNKRKESIYFKIISEILSQLNNSNISFTTVTEVKLSKDGSILKVYVTFEKNKNRSFEYLLKTSGYVRGELAKYPNQRIVPKIIFKYDETFESSRRIEEILSELKNKK